MTEEELSREINRITEGASALEKALMLSEAFRQCGNEMVIEAKPDGSFVLTRRSAPSGSGQ